MTTRNHTAWLFARLGKILKTVGNTPVVWINRLSPPNVNLFDQGNLLAALALIGMLFPSHLRGQDARTPRDQAARTPRDIWPAREVTVAADRNAPARFPRGERRTSGQHVVGAL